MKRSNFFMMVFLMLFLLTSWSSAENWRLGVGRENPGSAYEPAFGDENVTFCYQYRPNQGGTAMFAFPAPGNQKVIKEAKFFIFSMEGSCSNDPQMRLMINNMAGGGMMHIASDQVDVEASTVGSWVSFSLADSEEDRTIAEEEYLGVFFYSITTDCDLDVRIAFDILTDNSSPFVIAD